MSRHNKENGGIVEEKPKKNFWLKRLILAAILLFIAILLIWIGFLFGKTRPENLKTLVIRENSDQYKFINPILVLSVGDKTNFQAFKPLQDKVNDFINQARKNTDIQDVSFYFRSFKDETWTGVNEDDKYAPSSMLKVAVMISYLKLAENNPNILSEKVFYKPKIDPGQYFKPQKTLAEGWYTNEDLIKNMIEESDNSSAIQLIENQKDAVNKVYKDLQLPVPNSIDDIDFMSSKIYSRLFRVLYNGTYLTKELSEKALKLLSNTDFKVGLIENLPENTPIAHKFGERTVYNTNDGQVVYRELHDCGIVYKPNYPYFICVMTKGKEFKDLESIISGLSKLVYDSVGAN